MFFLSDGFHVFSRLLRIFTLLYVKEKKSQKKRPRSTPGYRDAWAKKNGYKLFMKNGHKYYKCQLPNEDETGVCGVQSHRIKSRHKCKGRKAGFPTDADYNGPVTE